LAHRNFGWVRHRGQALATHSQNIPVKSIVSAQSVCIFSTASGDLISLGIVSPQHFDLSRQVRRIFGQNDCRLVSKHIADSRTVADKHAFVHRHRDQIRRNSGRADVVLESRDHDEPRLLHIIKKHFVTV